MQKTELIIFDLDGTLVNSQYDLADAVNFALENMGRPSIEYEQVPGMVGSGVRKLLELALGHFTEKELLQARRLFDVYYEKNLTNKTDCYPGVRETLRYLRHIKKAVYSNKVHAYTMKIISDLGLMPYFDLVQGARPELYQRKPSPEGVSYILKKLKIQPARAVMVGDSDHDIHAARAAGAGTCAVTYGYRPLRTLLAANPDFTIDAMEELVRKLS